MLKRNALRAMSDMESLPLCRATDGLPQPKPRRGQCLALELGPAVDGGRAVVDIQREGPHRHFSRLGHVDLRLCTVYTLQQVPAP